MSYCYNFWYSYEEWNDLPVIRKAEKFVHNFGTIQTFENQKINRIAIRYKFSNDK